ncbi:MAG TPA: hypothetical protein VN700_05115 [Vicinamibacterales bacterium]|nr:hypothetical protein [Vicinamibacterales bacterium]
MSTRGIAVLLGFTVVIAGLTLVQDFSFDNSIARERMAALNADRDLDVIARSIADVRAAQAGYVATGQVPATWMTRATEAFDRLTKAIEARQVAAPTAQAKAKYEALGQTVANLSTIDGKARAAIAQEDRLHAADMIYIDAQQAAELADTELAAARTLEAQTATGLIGRLGMYRLGMNGLALALIAVIAISFGRTLSALKRMAPASTAQMLKDLPPAVKSAGAAPTLGLSSTSTPTPGQAVTAGPASPMVRPVSIAAAAELCVDLGRILDGRDMPALLERAAKVLDAKGIMIWSADSDGARLRPAMCFGYPDKIMARLRPLQVDADNVTSLAFRTMQPQALPGATSADAAAIAIPLITSSGCVGVLAAEVKQSRPHPDIVPIARIVAAQFSTLITPMDGAQPAAAQS